MDVAASMQAVADRLDVITGLRCYGYPVGKVTPPAAVVSYPTALDFDETYGRGSDRLTLPVVLVVGKASDRAARDALGAYCNGTGPRSVKATLESGAYTAFDSIRVVSVDFDVYTIAAVDYLTAIFAIDLYGQGS